MKITRIVPVTGTNIKVKKENRRKIMKKIKILLGLFLLSSLVACGNNEPKIELKKDEFVVEYGSVTSEEAKDYVKADKDILKETGISFKNVKYESRKDDDGNDIKYLEVGTYKATAVYKDETLDFKITVKDTTAPKFIDFQEKIEVEQNSTEDLITKFKVEDLSETTISLDMEKVDVAKAGEYETTVTAKDEYDNEIVKDITIIVKEKATAEETDAETNEGSTTSGIVDSSSTGAAGGSINTSGATGSTSTGGTTTNPSNPTPAPSEPIVQLTPTPQPSFIFDTWDKAENYGYEIIGDPAKRQALAQKYGYRDVAQTSSFVVTDVSFGYASNGIEVYSKVAVYFNLVR